MEQIDEAQQNDVIVQGKAVISSTIDKTKGIEITQSYGARGNDKECTRQKPGAEPAIAEEKECRENTEADNIDQRIQLRTEGLLIVGSILHLSGDDSIGPIKKHSPDNPDNRIRELPQNDKVDPGDSTEQACQGYDVWIIAGIKKHTP